MLRECQHPYVGRTYNINTNLVCDQYKYYMYRECTCAGGVISVGIMNIFEEALYRSEQKTLYWRESSLRTEA